MSTPPTNRKRQEIPATVKKEICIQNTNNTRMAQSEIVKFVEEKFDLNIGRSTKTDILKDREKGLNLEGSGNTTRARTAKFEQLERALLLWFNNARINNLGHQ